MPLTFYLPRGWTPWMAALALQWSSCVAAQSAVLTTEHVHAQLLAHAPEGIAPGKLVWLGLAIDHQPHWHTYWKNPGDSGLPTTLTWQLGGQAVAGDVAWPTPQVFKVGPLLNHGYEGNLLLPVPVTIAPGFSGDALRVRLQAEWLVCKDICVPESGDFVLEVPVRAATTAHAKRFDAALARVPRELPSVRARAVIERRALQVQADGLPAELHGRKLRFFAEMAGVVEHAAAIEQRWDGTHWFARVPLSSQRSESPPAMHAVLAPMGQLTGIRIRLPIRGSWAAASSTSQPAPGAIARASTDNASASPDTFR